MSCPTREQLVANVLGMVHDARVASHLTKCDTCRRAHDEITRVAKQLSTNHAELNRDHAVSRAALLARVENVVRPSSVGRPKRAIVGGLGIAAAAALLIAAFLITSTNKLSAMERMMKAVREVTSYSFKSTGSTTFPARDGKPRTILYETGFLCWRAPVDANSPWHGDLHSVIKAWRVKSDRLDDSYASEPRVPEWALNIEETYPCGKAGIIIVYAQGFYFFCPPSTPEEVPPDNWIAKLRAVQQGEGEIIRDLATKSIDGREAHGYVVDFKDAVPFKGYGPVEVWVDPRTDLPIEFFYEWRDDEHEGFVDETRVTDCRWNIELDNRLFETTPPPGLINTTAPKDEKVLAQMVAALRIYAELSGGNYPRVRTVDPTIRRDPDVPSDPPNLFDAGKIQSEMFELAGFSEDPGPETRDDPEYQKILSTTPGLDRLACVLYDHFHAGFYGADVRPQDKDKVLLWFMGDRGHWCVFYGDLHSEILPEEEWEKLIPHAADE